MKTPAHRLPWRAAISLAAALVVLSPTGAGEKPTDALPPDLALVGEAALFARFEVGSAWAGRESATLKKVSAAHPLVLTYHAAELDRMAGVSLGEIDRVVAIIPSFKEVGDAVVAISTLEPFDRDKVSKALAPAGKEVKAGEKSYIVNEKAGLAVHVVSRQTFLAGSPNGVKAALTKDRSKAGPLGEAVAAAAGKPLLAVGAVPGAFAAAVEGAGEQSKPYLPLFRARSWQLTAQGGDDLSIHFLLTFPDEARAKEGKPALEAALGQLDRYMAAAEGEFPTFLKREAGRFKGAGDLSEPLLGTIKATRAALKDFKAQQQGAKVRGTLRVKTKAPATALVLLASLSPRPEKKGPDSPKGKEP